ncbi:uncharacterized protein LAESUDRAFT_763855 [Laetiporus sulphureus 93-53]|uniref:Uncharacterized protein n=1 Tax=Laetiporus sulphureus 93-53 TaxID=1314785 RepID=A0A165BND4_9APHY|nr:uncharacterized protein LAESUDRAFT_763855 [Laetiporus sulphureus 93-53]KZT01359.1 hypothetical protein LAESUDRAFT_763855 [Laetiporus sulphureus 93-53]
MSISWVFLILFGEAGISSLGRLDVLVEEEILCSGIESREEEVLYPGFELRDVDAITEGLWVSVAASVRTSHWRPLYHLPLAAVAQVVCTLLVGHKAVSPGKAFVSRFKAPSSFLDKAKAWRPRALGDIQAGSANDQDASNNPQAADSDIDDSTTQAGQSTVIATTHHPSMQAASRDPRE